MSDNVKNVVTTALFIIIIFAIFIINLVKEDEAISISERRKLQQFPEFSLSNLNNGTFFEKFDKYTMDQFFQRENFRKVKTVVELDVFKKQDYNNIYDVNGFLIEQLYPLNEKSVQNMTNKINDIKNKYLTEENDVYYTIIPDKNYFINEKNLRLDYDKIEKLMGQNLEWAKYINIFDTLELNDYYYTDSHWKQEKIKKVANRIADGMNLKLSWPYTEESIIKFKGVYAGRLPLETNVDEIRVLTNDNLEECLVYNYETKQTTKVYDMSKTTAYDKYDVYLSGAVSLLAINNPNNTSGKELIIFRDSYGSSLTPLLIEAYSKVTVVDTRYISPKILEDYITFTNQDVLFAYSTLLINDSASLK